MTLKERIARAICAGNVTYNGPKDVRTHQERIDEEWLNWTDDAQAALEAMISDIETDLMLNNTGPDFQLDDWNDIIKAAIAER